MYVEWHGTKYSLCGSSTDLFSERFSEERYLKRNQSSLDTGRNEVDFLLNLLAHKWCSEFGLNLLTLKKCMHK